MVLGSKKRKQSTSLVVEEEEGSLVDAIEDKKVDLAAEFQKLGSSPEGLTTEEAKVRSSSRLLPGLFRTWFERRLWSKFIKN
jgi:K+/H+ antiporter YhaU regulatory subunit KhtT